jgi:undecaprenyl-diphosphatase
MPRRRGDEDGTIPAPMRDESTDTVTSGGLPAPLGARRTTTTAGAAIPRVEPLTAVVRPAVLLVALVLALGGYAAIAADVVNGGTLSRIDPDVAEWVADSMPAWAEWLFRPFTWLGGVVGMAIVLVGVPVALLRRRRRRETIVLLVVALGSQALVLSAKAAYERERPDVGSAIQLPSSFSFPSGHATTGVAVFGLLGLYAAALARSRSRRTAAIVAGFAVGALVGASRVVLNVHYLTDVLAGACLGLAWLCACLLVDAWPRSRGARADAG